MGFITMYLCALFFFFFFGIGWRGVNRIITHFLHRVCRVISHDGVMGRNEIIQVILDSRILCSPFWPRTDKPAPVKVL